MEVSQIKWVDRYLGSFSCFLLSILSRLSIKKRDKKTQKVLFIKLIEQGASVLAYTALKQAVERYGKENVYFMVFSENRPILDFLGVMDDENIIEIENKSFFSFFRDVFKGLLFCRKQRIDSCVDMEFFSRASAVLAFLSGAKKRVGLHRFNSEQPYRGNLMTHKVFYNPYIHVSTYYYSLLVALESEADREPKLKTPKKDYRIVHPQLELEKELLDSAYSLIPYEHQGKELIVLNANASDMLPLRKWEGYKFAALAERISNSFSDKLIVFTGIEKERSAIDKLATTLKDNVYLNLAGRTSLSQLMGLFQLAKIVITNDSGPAHFASILKTDVIVLFGPETPDLFAPLGDNIHVVYKNLACSPCVNVFNHRFSPCTDNICMQNISVDEVFDKVKQLTA